VETTPLLQAIEQEPIGQEQEEPKIITLTSNIELKMRLNINGRWVFNGNGHTLDLTDKNITIEEGAELILENITIKGLNKANIFCAGLNSKITILGNVTLQMSGYYRFCNGSFQVFENSHLHITNDPDVPTPRIKDEKNTCFAYLSMQPSYIRRNATLTISNTKFYYRPSTPDPFTGLALILHIKKAANNIILETESSTLALHNTTFILSKIPLQLTIGTLHLGEKNTFIFTKEHYLQLENMKITFETEQIEFNTFRKNKEEYRKTAPQKLIVMTNISY
jgi:hypothetical protein